jgi:hypothetical protein
MAKKDKKPKLQSAGPSIGGKNYFYTPSGQLVDEGGVAVEPGNAKAIEQFLDPFNPEYGKKAEKPKKDKKKKEPKAEDTDDESKSSSFMSSYLGYVGKNILQSIFPGYYELKNYKKDQTELNIGLSTTNALTKESSFMIRESLTNQDKIVTLLGEILKTLKGMSGLPSLPNIGGKTGGGKTKTGPKGRGRYGLFASAAAGLLAGEMLGESNKAFAAVNPTDKIPTGGPTPAAAPVDKPAVGASAAVTQATESKPSQAGDFVIDGKTIKFDSPDIEFKAENIVIDAKNLKGLGANQQTQSVKEASSRESSLTKSAVAAGNQGGSKAAGASLTGEGTGVGGSSNSLESGFGAQSGPGGSGSTAAVSLEGTGAGYSDAGMSKAEVAEIIKEEAVKAGIDPTIALRVAAAEGLNTYTGDSGTSFGPFQLHYKGTLPGTTSPGLGEEFTKDTGLHAKDPKTIREQIQWVFKNIRRFGWEPFHGAANNGIGKWDGIGRERRQETDPARVATGAPGGPAFAEGTVKPWNMMSDEEKRAASQAADAQREEFVAGKIKERSGIERFSRGDTVGGALDLLGTAAGFLPFGSGLAVGAGLSMIDNLRPAPVPPPANRPIPPTNTKMQPRSLPKVQNDYGTSYTDPVNPSRKHMGTISKSFTKYDSLSNLPKEIGF